MSFDGKITSVFLIQTRALLRRDLEGGSHAAIKNADRWFCGVSFGNGLSFNEHLYLLMMSLSTNVLHRVSLILLDWSGFRDEKKETNIKFHSLYGREWSTEKKLREQSRSFGIRTIWASFIDENENLFLQVISVHFFQQYYMLAFEIFLDFKTSIIVF